MKKTVLGLFAIAILGLVACHEHDDATPYVVNIAINKPTENQVVVKNNTLLIDVFLTRDNNQTIHNVKVEVTDTNGINIETLINKHYHSAGNASYTNDTYKPQSVGVYKLKVTTTDDDDLQANVKETRFVVTN